MVRLFDRKPAFAVKGGFAGDAHPSVVKRAAPRAV